MTAAILAVLVLACIAVTWANLRGGAK